MQLHFHDLGAVQERLLRGELADAKAFAFLLTQADSDPSMRQWDSQTRAVADAARAVKDAGSIDEGLRLEVRVALACANCHIAAGRETIFDEPAPLPADEPTVDARMARHVWAADRLWEGIVTPSEERWLAGLQVLAAAPLPFSNATDALSLSRALAHRAQFEIDNRAKELLEARATAYGELLITCAGCHAAVATAQR